MRIKDNQPAIDFRVKDIDGKWIELSTFREEKVLLSFFRYATCPFCNLRLHELIKRYPSYHKSGLQIIALFQSPRENLKKYVARKHDLPFPMVADPSHEIYKLYGVMNTSWWGYLKGLFRVPSLLKAFRKGFRPGETDGKIALIPTDFFIDKLVVVKAYYGKNISDHIPFKIIEEYLEKDDRS